MAEQIGKNRARFTGAEIGMATGGKGNFVGKVRGVQTDSRRTEQGNLFVALRGEKFDGHDYVEQVAKQGAAAALVEEQQGVDLPQIVVPDTLKALGDLARYHRQRFNVPVVAVTGSYGKTSTRALIHAALSAGGETLTSQANFNNEIGLPMTLFQLEEKHKFAVLEMGMRGLGQIDYLAKIAEPTVGVITNIGPQHIELLSSLENIARAKAELLKNLPKGSLAVLPADSPFMSLLIGVAEEASCRIITFGVHEASDCRISDIKIEADGNVSFIPSGPPRIKLSVPGAHNAFNAMAAEIVALELGIAPDAIIAALAKAELPGARMRVVKTETLTIIDDCYNAGPDSMRAALETLRDFPGAGRRVAVLGAMRELGEFSDDEHRKLGKLAGEICDVIIGVGPETRAVLEAIVEGENIVFPGWSPDAKQTIPLITKSLQPGDVVLVKGSRSVGLEVVVEALSKSR